MTHHRTAPNRPTVTLWFFWRRRAPKLLDTPLPNDFSPTFRPSYGSAFGRSNSGLSPRNSPSIGRSYDTYRGQNSNMHLTESLMAAFEATNDSTYLRMAEGIADLIANRHAAANGWRLPEHFNEDWRVNRTYAGSPVFRPGGTTPGHWLECRACCFSYGNLAAENWIWLPQCLKGLFAQAVADGWDKIKGGFYYTLDWDGVPLIRDRYWWPCCEGVGASAFLNAIDGDLIYERWYHQIWSFIATRFIDREKGGWRAQLDDKLRPNPGPFFGKVDIYHSLQACLIPTLPTTGIVTHGLLGFGSRVAS